MFHATSVLWNFLCNRSKTVLLFPQDVFTPLSLKRYWEIIVPSPPVFPLLSAQTCFESRPVLKRLFDTDVENRTPSTVHQTPSHNIDRQKSEPHRSTETLSIRDTFKCIFPDKMIDPIIKQTNKKTKKICEAYNSQNPEKKQLLWENLTESEFYDFLEILIISDVNNSKTDHTLNVWKRL